MKKGKNEKERNRTAPIKKESAFRSSRTKIAVIVSAVCLVAIVVGVVLGIILANKNSEFDYLADDLSRYITLEDSDYKGCELKINIPGVSELDVQNEIIKLLAKNRGSSLYGGEYVNNRPINAGDEAYIWYRGYEIDERGYEIDFSGGSNFRSEAAGSLKIGSGSFIAGFELALVGIVGTDYSRFEKIKEGTVAPGDAVYITCDYVEETGEFVSGKTIRIDTADEYCDKLFGVGIRDYLVGCSIGVTREEAKTFTNEAGEKITYANMKVDFATRCEIKPITIDVTFPYDYQEESLRGKRVKFDVYIEKVLHFEPKSFDDDFVKNTLNIKEEALSEYAGETLSEKYQAYIRKTLEDSKAEEIKYAKEDAYFEHLRNAVEVKRYPEAEVERAYENAVSTIRAQYISGGYSKYYATLDKFVIAAYGLSADTNWQDYIEGLVREQIVEKMIFYSIIRREGLILSDEEYNRLYRQTLESDYKSYYNREAKDFESEEKYLEALRKFEEQVIKNYGEDYYHETVYYNAAIDKILNFANFKNEA